MAGYKRKRDDFDDSDSDEPSFGKQILPVADLPDDFDGPPADGLQYLFTVRRDARCRPHITRATNPYEITVTQPPHIDDRVIPSSVTLPSEEWRALFETRYKNFRKNVNQPTIGVPMVTHDERHRLMPDKKERDLWWNYLAGKPEADWNPVKHKKPLAHQYQAESSFIDADISFERGRQESWQTNDEGEVELVLRVDPSESLPTPTGSPVPPDAGEGDPSLSAVDSYKTISFKPREPMPSILGHIDQQMALHLLMYFTHWINNHIQKPDSSFHPIEAHARWIFALLSRVGEQVSADDMNLLRNLARACIALLKQLLQPQAKPEDLGSPPQGDYGENNISIRSCWIVISTVAGVWAQRDLWLDAEDMLKSHGS